MLLWWHVLQEPTRNWSLFAGLKCLPTAEGHTLFKYCAALQPVILVTYFQSRTALLCEPDL